MASCKSGEVPENPREAVADPSGAIVPRAKVTLTNNETGSQHGTVNYGHLELSAGGPPGGAVTSSQWSSRSQQAGTYERLVQVGGDPRVDVVLQLGTATQAIEMSRLDAIDRKQ